MVLKKQKKHIRTLVDSSVNRAAEFEFNLLERGEKTDVNHRDDESFYSRFEKACRSRGAREEIVLLISMGAKVNEMNPTTEEFPIHLVAECGDPSNVAALLEHGSTKIYIDQDYQHDTALLMLFRSIDATNFESHFACIKLLLAHGADINMTNDLNLPPIVCESLSSLEPAQQDQVIAHCLDKVTFYARGDYGRRMLVKTFGEGRLPPGSCPDYGAESVTVGQLRSWLFDGKEDKFLANYRKVPAINGNFKCQIVKEFLLICVQKGYEMTLKVLMEENLSDLAQYRSKLLEQCSIYGNDRIIPLLTVDTERTSQNGGLLLSIIPLIEVDSDECAHYRCAKLILQNPLTELDREDGIGHTALHYAVRYNRSNVQEILLQRGAYIGAKNRYDELPIAEMDPTELEAHLDSCVTCKSVIIGDKQYEIDVDLKNFVPPIHKVRDQEHKNGTGNVHAPENDEMRCVIELGKMANMKHLLQHPVVLTILLEKFGKLRWFLLANLLVCFCFYAISVLTLAFDVGTFQGMANTLLLALFALMFIRDGLILGSNWRRVDVYKSLLTVCHVCLNCILLGAPMAFPSILRYRWIPAFIILWRAAQLTVLLGTLSVLSWSISLAMFKTVSKNILKFLALYFVLIVAFALCFYMLCAPTGSSVSVAEPLARNVSLNFTANRNISVDTIDLTDTTKDAKSPPTISSSLLKVSLMIMGELSTDDIQPNEYVERYIFFAVFLFVMPLVLFTLMNALAVTDTTSIVEEAELISIAKTASVIHEYEHLETFYIGGSSLWLKIFSNNADTHRRSIKINRYHKKSNPWWANLSEFIFCHDLVSKRDTKVMQILSNSRKSAKGKDDEKLLVRLNEMSTVLNAIQAQLNRTG